MNKIIVFEHPQFGQIRTVEIDGKIWFCESDIASALGYSNPRDAIVRHCKPMGVVIYDTPTRSAVQSIKYINEGRSPAASCLPPRNSRAGSFETLRNGGYIPKKKGETDNELLARAVLLAQGRIKERDEYISQLHQENKLTLLELKQQAPKVTYR